MSEFTEITAENLRFVRGSKSINQEEIAAILAITQTAVSKIESGNRGLSGSEKSLLDLYFFGTIPFEIVNEKLFHGVLDFTTDQWKVISILANRKSMTPGQWIADRVRWLLAGDETARQELADHLPDAGAA